MHQGAAAALGLSAFVGGVEHLIDGSISLFDLLYIAAVVQSVAFLCFSTFLYYLYCLFSGDTSYKNSRLCEYNTLVSFGLRTALVAMDIVEH